MMRAAVKLFGRLPSIDYDDLEQDLYCRLLAARSPGLADLEISNYIRKVAFSVVLDHRRNLSAEKRRLEVEATRTLEADEVSGESAQSGWPLTPDEELRRREGWREVRRHGCQVSRNGELGRIDLEALWLTLICGCTSREACEAMDGRVSPGYVDRLVYRLRQSLMREGIRLPRRRSSVARPSMAGEGSKSKRSHKAAQGC